MERNELLEISKEHLWLPFTQMKDYHEDPLIIARGEGVKLIDVDGKEYYDAYSSLWLNIHGHRNEKINEAIKAQLDQVAHTTLLGATNIPATKLAKKLIEISPEPFTKVFYSDNGSTAIEVAIKMTYQYWKNIGKEKKTKFVTLQNGYHGDTVGTMSVGSIDLYHHVYTRLLFDAIALPFPDVYRHPSGDEAVVLEEALGQLEELFKERHEEIAGMVVESIVQGAGGMNLMPKGYLKGIQDLCRKYDILLIVDEVATGFGRTGKMFAIEHEGVEPDFLALAKGITGGYLPIAATLTTDRIYEAFYGDYNEGKTFFHGHSYTGNQLGCAAALANLELFEEENLVEQVAEKAKYLTSLLEEIEALDCVGEVRQLGFITGIELVKNKETKEPFPGELRLGYKATLEMRKLGLLTRPLGDVIVFMPPLVTNRQELKEMLAIVKEGIERAVNEVRLVR